jgi:dolichyl-phosphate beta-glucosyltransferase
MGWLPKLSPPKLGWSPSSRGSAWSKKCLPVEDWAITPDFWMARSILETELETNIYPESIQDSVPDAVQGLPLHLRSVSIILPVYNEQACINRTFEAVLEYAQQHPFYTFWFVNDGSSDRTEHLLQERIAHAATTQIRLISYRNRGGKGYAIRQGMAAATDDCVCFTDGDLAYSLDHLEPMIAQLAYFDLVIGSRNLIPGGTRGPHLTRKVAGEVFNCLSRWLMNLPYKDMQAGLKGFRRQAAQELFSRQSLLGFSFDVELLYLARKLGYSIGEIPAQVSGAHARKLSKVNLLVDSLKMLLDLVKIRLNDVMGRYE